MVQTARISSRWCGHHRRRYWDGSGWHSCWCSQWTASWRVHVRSCRSAAAPRRRVIIDPGARYGAPSLSHSMHAHWCSPARARKAMWACRRVRVSGTLTTIALDGPSSCREQRPRRDLMYQVGCDVAARRCHRRSLRCGGSRRLALSRLGRRACRLRIRAMRPVAPMLIVAVPPR